MDLKKRIDEEWSSFRETPVPKTPKQVTFLEVSGLVSDHGSSRTHLKQLPYSLIPPCFETNLRVSPGIRIFFFYLHSFVTEFHK